jgi:diguanylate cyclase (GGDEF)-like protein
LWTAFAFYCLWIAQTSDLRGAEARAVSLGFTLLPKVVAGVAFLVLRRLASGRLRTAWTLLFAAQASDSLADLLFTALGYPPISIADAWWILYYGLFLAGLLYLPFVPVTRRERTILVLDVAMVLAACASLTGYVVAPRLVTWATLGNAARLNLAYPVLELLLVAAAAALVQRDVEGVRRATLVLLALSSALSVAGTLLYAWYVQVGNDSLLRPYFVERALHVTLLASAALWQLLPRSHGLARPAEPSKGRRLLRQSLPQLAAALSLVVLVVAGGGSRAKPRMLSAVLGTTFVTALLLYRQNVVARENLRLYEDLDQAHRRLSLQAVELAEMATVDGLTGIPNRRAFDACLDEEWRRAARQRHWLTLVLVDVDHFKAYNDTYGHTRGDECLRAVAQALARSCRRAADLAARYGGEEFVLLLPETDPPGAQVMVTRVLEAVRDLAAPHESSSCAAIVTVSVGAVSLVPAKEGTALVALEQADAALYEAKGNGRNQGRLVAEAKRPER